MADIMRKQKIGKLDGKTRLSFFYLPASNKTPSSKAGLPLVLLEAGFIF